MPVKGLVALCRRRSRTRSPSTSLLTAHHRDDAGHRLVVRNGHKPPRTILTGVGPMEVNQPRVDDRRVDENGVRFRFTSKILPPYLRKTKAIEDLVPWLYLKGISTGEMPRCVGPSGV